jgi:Holliday junction resolvasome RuvABC ATP-dependent DNA helicase subunit
VNDWSPIFLGIIALATLVMASIQVGAIVIAVRLARQMRELVTTVQSDIRPLIARANLIAEEASKTASMATVQAQKIDRLVTDLTRRVDETASVVQHAIITPAREGLAIFAAVKAGIGALRSLRDQRGRHTGVEDEDALFIG